MDETTLPQAEAPDSPGYEIGRPTIEDIPALLELWKEQYDFHHARDPVYYVPFTDELRARLEVDLSQMIGEEEPHIFVAREGSNLVGFTYFEKGQNDYPDTNIKKFGVINELLVTKDARGKEIGRGLVRAAIDYFAGQGQPDVEVHVSSDNPEAEEFYEREGFVARQTVMHKRISDAA